MDFKLISRPDVAVLRGLNLEIKGGQYVALVGPSGCGKSTCISLIERFYDPSSGQIVVDDISVPEYHLADYRKSISLVSQEPTFPLLSFIRLLQTLPRNRSLQYRSWI
jgi:ATP-binding cassette subfamily B (MDR/TAP) protein 1